MSIIIQLCKIQIMRVLEKHEFLNIGKYFGFRNFFWKRNFISAVIMYYYFKGG
jgi:hypothetical protein